MPYVYKNKEDNQILTAMLQNTYGLAYYGTVFLNDPSEEEKQKKVIFDHLEIPGSEWDDWDLVKVDESQLKLFNVKLNNNPQKKLYLDDTGKSFVE